MSDIAIRVQNITKAYQIYDKPQDRLKQSLCQGRKQFYREFKALDDVSFEVKKGETVGIIGRNGSGKSTLLQIICGTLAPTSGTVEVNGRVAALLELGAGFNPEFTGKENVYMNATILGLSKEEIDAKYDEIVAFADIGDFIDQPVKTYSSGMYARLAFSVVIHVDPDVLIVDEILAVGDSLFQAKCVKKFYEIKESGCTIVFVSHDEYQVRHVCDYAAYLKEGNLVYFGNTADAFDAYKYDLGLMKANISEDIHELKKSTFSFQPFSINHVSLVNEVGEDVSRLGTHEMVRLIVEYECCDLSFCEKVSLVVNLYQHDSLYLFGTTTLMEGIEPFILNEKGKIEILFPNIPLLRGNYKWRVAINDERGLAVLAEACPVCPFDIIDDFQAVGIIDISRKWLVNGENSGAS